MDTREPEPGPAADAERRGPAAAPPFGRRVRIYEVGPRDGLQNEAARIATRDKLRYVELLLAAGLREIEATSFVSPRAIPQLADAEDLLRGIRSLRPTADARFPVLVPNVRGLERAERAEANAVAVFTAATDAFTEHNIGMTIAASLEAFRPVLARAGELGWWRRAYVSTAFGCPYTGAVDPARPIEVGLRLLDLGAEEICFGDTIGVGVPPQVTDLVDRATLRGLPLERIAFHFHDTRGTALANVAAALGAGVRCFDSSAGGTGGCPYAPGAAGNLATEDLVYLLDAMGFEHGVRLDALLDASRFVAGILGRPLASKVGQAGGWDARTGLPVGRRNT